MAGGLLALSACSGSDQPTVAVAGGGDVQVPVPANYGLYAFDDGAMVRLDGDPQWERQTWSERNNLSPRTEFVVFNRAVMTDQGSLGQLVLLRRVARLRNEVSATGVVTPAGNRWVVPDMGSYAVPLNFRPVAARPDMVVADPIGDLPPGLYALQLHDSGQTIDSRLGIRWPDLSQASYVANNCVDRYPDGYRSCADSDAAMQNGQTAAASAQPPAAPPAGDAAGDQAAQAGGQPPSPAGAPPPAAGGQPANGTGFQQPGSGQPGSGQPAFGQSGSGQPGPGQVAVAPLGGAGAAAVPPLGGTGSTPVAPLGGTGNTAPPPPPPTSTSTSTPTSPAMPAATPPATPAAASAPPAAPAAPAAAPAPTAPATAAAAPAGGDIVVRNLVSSRSTGAGGAALLIEGNVINQSGTARPLPQLYANILNAQGVVLQHVALEGIPPTTLAPGDSYHFRSEVPDPPPDAVKVRVTPGA
jgi:hypothetical protein